MSAISARRINASSADVVNAHWTNFGYLSIGQIGRITKPFIWTLHDMWAFTGGQNYASDDALAPWRSGYAHNTAGNNVGRWDLESWVWRRKHKHWKQPLSIVTPSRWLASLAQQSQLLSDSHVRVIPNPLSVGEFRPYPKSEARGFHGLPPEASIVLFGLTNDLDDPRKGWDLLKTALLHTRSRYPEVELAVMGPHGPPEEWSHALPKAHWLGRLNDDKSLAMAYSAADVTVVPSRQDNLPQVGTEAQSCGCPVIAFRVSGLSDVVADETTGYLAGDLNALSLSNALADALNDRDRLRRMGLAARERAVSLWSPEVVARQYVDVYQEVIDRTRR
jgi:glycosyltransferase involved in cell wall biosynthesis